MKKNYIITLITGLLMILILVGCDNNQPADAENVHTHTASETWEWDATNHWHVCECGKVMDSAIHAVGDDLFCTDCGTEIWDFGDGYIDALSYDEYGNCLKQISYDPNGNIISELSHEYEYDEAGNVLRDKFYVDGMLQSDDEYIMGADGWPCPVKSTYYHESGEYFINEYDSNGNGIKFIGYDKAGNVLSETYSEYALNSDGEWYEVKYTEINENGEKLIAEYNEYGDAIRRTIYDTDGNLTSEDVWEFEYNEEGDHLWEKQYRNGILVFEITGYASGSDDEVSWRYPEVTIEYYEDGTKLVSKFGENTEVETETMYNADDTVAYVRTYIYETFEDGNWKSIKVYEDDELIKESEYAMDEEYGWSYKAKETVYHEDGTTVYEYDKDGNVIS